MSKCKSCGAPVVWAKTENDKNIPLDAKKVRGGNIFLDHGIARIVSPLSGLGSYESHFKTCPQAREHRRPR